MIKLPFSQELINGKGEPECIEFRVAVPEDIDEVVKLQETIVNALPDKDLYSTSTREEYLTQLKEDVCFIAECNGQVAGFSVMVPNDPDNPRNYGLYLGYDRDQLARTASLDLTMVHPEFRGRGIQRIFNKLRIGKAVEMGASEGLCTISPDNPYSYRNFLVLNFEIIETRTMYGGKQRYILRKVF
ncbi:MAG: GNAT family N-acetyltransferase [Mogibacterium sp.]|nr:GNAT family N-acetyltransferase [Mogibacterium sp.]